MSSPGFRRRRAARIAGTSGRSSFKRLLRATTTTTATPDATTFCWNGRFSSTVRNASKPSASISLRSSLLRLLDHPRSTTVLTSCPVNSRLSGRGTHSSSRSRTSFCHLTPELQCCNRPVASNTREIVQKLVEGVACFEIVVQGLDGHASPDEDGSAAEDIRVTVNDRLLGHSPVSRGSLSLSIHQRVVGA